MSVRAAIETLVYTSALRLDAGDFAGYLELCAPEFRYLITAYSPEIRQEMIWLDHDKAGLQALFETLSRHHSDPSPLSRHVTLYTVEVAADGGTAAVVSALMVFRTALDGGATELFAVGKMHDIVTLASGPPRLAKRQVRLDTRMLGIGSHIPF
jgi:methanesulfonate monooxygenase subunit beta